MRLFAFAAAVCAALCSPMIATAAPLAPPGSVYHSVVPLASNDAAVLPTSPLVIRSTADRADQRAGVARHSRAAVMQMTRSTAPLAFSPLEVGARLAGSVRAA